MKKDRSRRLRLPQPQKPSGSALLLALGLVALLTLLIAGFLLIARTEFTSSKFYARGINTKLLSDTALNLVTAQIGQATRSTDALSGGVVAWASQPGMIRTFDTAGNPVSDYKLYSWDNMAVAAGSFSQTAETPPTGWDAQKDVWTDLNEPVQTSSNGPIYPILQGNNSVAGISLQSGLKDVYGNAVPGKSYHMATDSGSASSLADVEGFSVGTAPSQTAANPVNPDVPMPVKWLYVLQDGTTVAAQSSGSGTAATVPGASSSNKIVGRIAFWTDDETSKVNINTASEGNFWDVPLADGREERTLAVNIPVQGEYQRIPGHPATVSLSSVFGASNQLFPSVWNPPNQVNFTLPADTNTLQQRLFGNLPGSNPYYYGLAPRLAWGGTQFGTAPYPLVAETSTSPAYFKYTGATIPGGVLTAPAALVTKANRLYSTVDELLFQPTTASAPTRTPNLNMTAAALDQAKFFITANSRAPEVTLFNTPRVSIWPITWPNTGIITGGAASIPVTNTKPNPLATNPFFTNTAPPMLMPEEKLLAFCGTVGGVPYYFQRQNAYDPQGDYLNISRNQQLMTYLDNMTTQSVPGFGGDFRTKYGNDRPQILTEIFDYIRSGPNLNNSVADGTGALEINYNYAPIASRNFTFSPYGGNNNNGGSGTYGGGCVVPITINHGGATTHGAGRFPTITEAALVFYAVDRKDPQPGTPNSADPSSPNGKWEFISQANAADPLSGSQTTLIGTYLLLNIYNPETGRLVDTPFFITEITGAPFSVNGHTINFPQSTPANGRTLINMGATAVPALTSNDSFMGSIWTMAGYSGGTPGYAKGLNRNPYPGTSSVPSSPTSAYPFYGDFASVDPSANTFAFSGTVATLKIYPVIPGAAGYPPDTANGPIQTITLDFTKLSGTYPIPVAPEYNYTPIAGDNTLPVPTPAPTGILPAGVTVPTGEVYQQGFYYFSRTNLVPGGVVDSSTGATPTVPWNGTNPQTNTAITWDERNLLARSQCSHNVTYTSPPSALYLFNQNYPTLNAGSATPLIVQAYNVIEPTGAPLVADTVISLRLNPAPIQQGGQGGDARLVALNSSITKPWFLPHYAVSTTQSAIFPVRGAHSLAIGQNQTGPASDAEGTSSYLRNFAPPLPTNDAAPISLGYIRFEGMFGYVGNSWPAFSQQFNNAVGNPSAWVGQNTTSVFGLTQANPVVGDFCNGIGYYTDGAIIPKPDDTTFALSLDPVDHSVSTPYFQNFGIQSTAPYFSPARQLSGPVALGVLPTGAQAGTPWQTLAFNPNPMAGPTHPGLQSPKDHLFLDLFWMPVVEPYAISEPLSTAGKINMNYEIEPFTYISRKTALYAAMKSDKILAIPNGAKGVYKNADLTSGGPDSSPSSSIPYGTQTANTWGFHFPIDIATTLQQFDTVFGAGNIFRSASQICEIFLQPRANPLYTPPAGFTLPSPDGPGSTSSISGWWSSGNTSTNMTGTNGRQQPYAHLYSLLTTKSNTFQVHMRVQVLTKNSTTNPSVFDESAGDSVVGEYRGSAIVERYVDANDTTLPDFASTFTAAGQNTLDPYYRFRIVSTKAFTPR